MLEELHWFADRGLALRSCGALMRGEHGDAVAVSGREGDGDEEVGRALLRGVNGTQDHAAWEVSVEDNVA